MATTIGQIVKRHKASEAKIVTPRLDEWLVRHPEGLTVPPSLMPLVQRLLSSPNSDRSARFGASSRGICHRRQVFAFLGMPVLMRHDPILQNLFNDGTWRHIRWQLTTLVAGIAQSDTWDVPSGEVGAVDEAPVEVTHVLPQYHTKVSTDFENTREAWGGELKGTSWFSKILEHGLPEAHQLQVHTYFIATGYDRFVYIGEDKRSNNWTEIIVRPDPTWMKRVKDELNALSDSIEDQRLPAIRSDCRAQKGEDFKGCPYKHICLGCRDEDITWPA